MMSMSMRVRVSERTWQVRDEDVLAGKYLPYSVLIREGAIICRATYLGRFGQSPSEIECDA